MSMQGKDLREWNLQLIIHVFKTKGEIESNKIFERICELSTIEERALLSKEVKKELTELLETVY